MDRPRASYVPPLALGAGVAGVVLALALWHPLARSAPTAPAVGVGDVVAGEAVFADRCAGCHGPGGEGGAGPRLIGRDVTADEVATVIAAGRGAMPAGLVSGRERNDVVAFVGSLTSGGGVVPEAGASEETDVTESATAAQRDQLVGGWVDLLGGDLVGFRVRLDEPATVDLPVKIRRDEDRTVGTIAAGESEFELRDAGVGSLLDWMIQVGDSAAQPSDDARDAIRALVVRSPRAADRQSLVAGLESQADVLAEHTRFLEQALVERNIFNVRFHAEHLFNIVRGAPLRDLDGNGEASNPGDGVGLASTSPRDGYVGAIADALERIDTGNPGLAEPAADAATRIARTRALLGSLARRAQQCGAIADIPRSRGCVNAISRLEGRVTPELAAIADGAASGAPSLRLQAP